MDEEFLEYRVPARLLTNRDPIILSRLSMREFFQWAVVAGLVYLSFNALPLEFTFKLVIAATLAMFGGLFIHSPINGLAGIEWAFVYLRFKSEGKRHRTVPYREEELTGDFRITASLSFGERSEKNSTKLEIVNQAETTGENIHAGN